MFTLAPLRCCALLLPLATLLDAATAASRATLRCCDAPRRCKCCFQGHATLQQRSQTMQTAASWAAQRCRNAT